MCVSLPLRNKYLLLNSQELNELSAISMKANIPEVEALVNTDRSLVCDGKKGLLTRILTVMKREPPDSSFRSGVAADGWLSPGKAWVSLTVAVLWVRVGSGRRGRWRAS